VGWRLLNVRRIPPCVSRARTGQTAVVKWHPRLIESAKAQSALSDRHGQNEITRWIEVYERFAEIAAEMPATRLVYIADRNGEPVDMMMHAQVLGSPPTGWCWPSTVPFPFVLSARPKGLFRVPDQQVCEQASHVLGGPSPHQLQDRLKTRGEQQ
jgi:hypothetical protein